MNKNEFNDYQKASGFDSIAILARAILLDKVSIHTYLDNDGTAYKQIEVAGFKYERET